MTGNWVELCPWILLLLPTSLTTVFLFYGFSPLALTQMKSYLLGSIASVFKMVVFLRQVISILWCSTGELLGSPFVLNLHKTIYRMLSEMPLQSCGLFTQLCSVHRKRYLSRERIYMLSQLFIIMSVLMQLRCINNYCGQLRGINSNLIFFFTDHRVFYTVYP